MNSLKAILRGTSAFVRWLCVPEKLESLPPNETTDQTPGSRSFRAFLLRQDPLPPDASESRRGPDRQSILTTLLMTDSLAREEPPRAPCQPEGWGILRFFVTPDPLEREEPSGAPERISWQSVMKFLFALDPLDPQVKEMALTSESSFVGWLLEPEDLNEPPTVAEAEAGPRKQGLLRWLARRERLDQ